MESRCLVALEEACGHVLEVLSNASEAAGKGRASGSGTARLLRKAALLLEKPVETCIRGCWQSREPRCLIGELLERFKNTIHGVSLRLESLGRLSGEVEAELLAMLLDAVYALVEALCRSARQYL